MRLKKAKSWIPCGSQPNVLGQVITQDIEHFFYWESMIIGFIDDNSIYTLWNIET